MQSATLQFDLLYRTQFRRIFAICRRRLDTHEDAEDATSEVFRIAWQLCVKGEVPGRAWLAVVARNVIGDHYRRAKRRREVTLAASSRQDETHSVGVDPEVAAEIRRQLGALDERDRTILFLTYWDGMTCFEVSQSLGLSTSAVWTRLSRARERLRVAMRADR